MASQSDRTSDGLAIANGSQIIAVTAPEADTASAGRTPFVGETSHHGVTFVTRASAAPAPVEPRDDMMTGLSIIEGIDLDADVPCGHSKHNHPGPFGHADEPASYIVEVTCSECDVHARYPLCRSGLAIFKRAGGSICSRCGILNIPAPVHIVEVLR